jgi:hypothetical protein
VPAERLATCHLCRLCDLIVAYLRALTVRPMECVVDHVLNLKFQSGWRLISTERPVNSGLGTQQTQARCPWGLWSWGLVSTCDVGRSSYREDGRLSVMTGTS